MTAETDLPNQPQSPNLVKLLVPLVADVMQRSSMHREYEILRRRFGLEGTRIYTLQEIGDYYRVSRERIRQLERRALHHVRMILLEEPAPLPSSPSSNVRREAREIRSVLATLGPVLTESQVISTLKDRYQSSIGDTELHAVRFLLEIFGFAPIPPSFAAGSGHLRRSWVTSSSFDIRSLEQAVRYVHKELRASVSSLSSFDLTVAANRRVKRKVDIQHVVIATSISEHIEQLPDGSFRLKFENLPSLADKAFRVLQEAGQPLHLRDIARAVSHRLALAGIRAGASSRSIQNQMIQDARFLPIGHSGNWSLAAWKHIRRDTIVDLMKEFFHLDQRSATVDEVYESVNSKRPDASKQSVAVYLTTLKQLFVRVSRDQYELSAWGTPPAPTPVTELAASKLVRIEEEAARFLRTSHGSVLPLSHLVRHLGATLKIPDSTIYRYIAKSRRLATAQDPRSPKRRLVRIRKRPGLPPLPSKPPRLTIRHHVHAEAERYLRGQPGFRASLSQLVAHLAATTHTRRPTIYSYISDMKNVQKTTHNGLVECTLVAPRQVPRDYPRILDIQDEALRASIERALGLLTIDEVDVGLFQLGREFEAELTALLRAARAKGAFPVRSKDLGGLASMIDCLERNGIVSDKHHLTFLRQERNERAHGAMPSLARRQALLKQSPFLAGLFIDYIAQFHGITDVL